MIKHVIFDFGGVFVAGNRTSKFCNYLSLSNYDKAKIELYFSSNIIKESATGLGSEEQILEGLAEVIPCKPEWLIEQAFDYTCKPSQKILTLLSELKKTGHKVSLVSNSIPPYSARIRNNTFLCFDDVYLSDEQGMRKPNDLYGKIVADDPLFFNDSICIDDQLVNLDFPQLHGSAVIHYKTFESLLAQLRELGIQLENIGSKKEPALIDKC